MSKSLIKLIDYALIPAITMVVGKFLGVIFVAQGLGIELTISKYTDLIFSFATFAPEEEIIKIVSYSNLIMYSLVATVFSFTLIKAVYFHDTHIKPTLTTKLIEKNLFYLVQSTYDIYHAGTINLVFVWISTMIVIFDVLSGLSYLWVGAVVFLSSITLTIILLRDVYKEVENIKTKPGMYNWE